LQTGGRVHGVAERRILDAAPRADGPHDDGAGLDADPHAEPADAPGVLDLLGVVADLLDDPQGRAHRPLGIVLVGCRRPEQRQDPVAGKVLDGAPERFNRIDHAGDGVADDQLQLLRV
jgi:hypothetical protein